MHLVRPSRLHRSTKRGGCWATQRYDGRTTARWRLKRAARCRGLGAVADVRIAAGVDASRGDSWHSWLRQESGSSCSACSPTTPSKPGPPDNVLEPGSCVVLEDNGDASEVNCDTDHDGVVVSLITEGPALPDRPRTAPRPAGPRRGVHTFRRMTMAYDDDMNQVDEIATTASLATLYGRIAQLVRVRRSHRRGPRFESVYAHPNSRCAARLSTQASSLSSLSTTLWAASANAPLTPPSSAISSSLASTSPRRAAFCFDHRDLAVAVEIVCLEVELIGRRVLVGRLRGDLILVSHGESMPNDGAQAMMKAGSEGVPRVRYEE